VDTQPNHSEKANKDKLGFSGFDKFRTSFRSSSKNEAIRRWEQRQESKRDEKGLIATMDAKDYGNSRPSYEGWGKSNTKEKIRTVYIPIRVNSNDSNKEKEENNSKGLKQEIYEEKGKAKVEYWIEFSENFELSVDTPTYLQRNRKSSLGSSAAMTTIFESYDDEDSFVESDEINLVLSCTEHDGDWDSTGEFEDKDSDIDEAEEAMRLTRPFNMGAPVGRRCPKIKTTLSQDQIPTDKQNGVPENNTVLRLKGGSNSTTGKSDNPMESEPIPSTSNGKRSSTDMREYKEIVTPPSKRTKENTLSPVKEADKAGSFHERGRMVLRYFEKFKAACKKKLSATAQQELNREVDMVSKLLTEVCTENMIIYGRYLELKENAEEKKKKVDFTDIGETTASENVENKEKQELRKKRMKKRKRAISGATSGQSSGVSETEDNIASGTDVEASEKENGKKKKKKSKKAKEKEILDKCREQEAPVKYAV
jgi:hypothetical protein